LGIGVVWTPPLSPNVMSLTGIPIESKFHHGVGKGIMDQSKI